MLEVYEKSVAELKHDMINLGMKVEQAVENAWKAMEDKDIELAQRIYDGDDVIDFYKERGTSSQASLMRDKDDIVDQAFNNLMETLAAEMAAHPENSKDYIDLVLVIKYIERMADHANNIAEWLIYRDTNEIRI